MWRPGLNETTDGIGRPAAWAEVAERLAGRLHAERLVEELVHPAAGGDDDGIRVELVRTDARAVANVQPARERGERPVSAHDPGLRLHDDE